MSTQNTIILSGIDGSNPLGFLAALGTLRALTRAWPDKDVRMRWVQHSGAWRPEVSLPQEPSQESLLNILDRQLKTMGGHFALGFADNLSVTSDAFRAFAQAATKRAQSADAADALVAAEFAAAFACDALQTEQSTVQDTALRTMAGAGHQHFLASMRHIIAQTDVAHLQKTLFEVWMYDDPIAKQSLRWDPLEDSRYALQWRDPSGDPSRKERGTMLGANRLAIEGIPMLACAPTPIGLRTTGFSGRGARDTFLTWPLWEPFVQLEVCKSLVSINLAPNLDTTKTNQLQAMGVCAVFRSQRITTGKFRNFTPACALL